MSRLPDGYRVVRLVPEVRQRFADNLAYSFGDMPNAGLMYGRTLASRELVIHYVAPFFLDVDLAQMFERGYALGRIEAQREAAWQLRALQPIGYWLAYTGELPSLSQVLLDLEVYAKLDPVVDEFAVLIAARPLSGATVMAAYTYDSRQPVTAWRLLKCR